MKPLVIVGTAAVVVALVAGIAWREAPQALAAQKTKADQMPVFQFDPSWPKIPLPNNWALGTVTGVDVDEHEHVWIIHRPHTLLHNYEDGLEHNPPTALCCRMAPPVLEFDQAGNLLRSWGGPGEGFQWPQHAPADMHAPANSSVASWNGEHTIYVDYQEHVWVGNNAGTGATATS